MGGSRKLHQGDPEKVLCFLKLSSMYFAEGLTDPPQEAIGPNGSNCFSRGSVPEFLGKLLPVGGSLDPPMGSPVP